MILTVSPTLGSGVPDAIPWTLSTGAADVPAVPNAVTVPFVRLTARGVVSVSCRVDRVDRGTVVPSAPVPYALVAVAFVSWTKIGTVAELNAAPLDRRIERGVVAASDRVLTVAVQVRLAAVA